jgi:hypothetical protein
VGDIGSESDEQRIAVVDGAVLTFVSPADLYVYEFDFLPNGGSSVRRRRGMATASGGWRSCMCSSSLELAWCLRPVRANSWRRLRYRPMEKA